MRGALSQSITGRRLLDRSQVVQFRLRGNYSQRCHHVWIRAQTTSGSAQRGCVPMTGSLKVRTTFRRWAAQAYNWNASATSKELFGIASIGSYHRVVSALTTIHSGEHPMATPPGHARTSVSNPFYASTPSGSLLMDVGPSGGLIGSHWRRSTTRCQPESVTASLTMVARFHAQRFNHGTCS